MSNQIIVKTKFYGVIDRSGNKFNRYINDKNLVLVNHKRIQTKKFSKSFKSNNNAILIVTSDWLEVMKYDQNEMLWRNRNSYE